MGRLPALCAQASELGYHIVGIQESTAADASFQNQQFFRFVTGLCPRRNKRVELWVTRSALVGNKCIARTDVTLIAQGEGFGLFRIHADALRIDVAVGHAPHSDRP